MTTKSLPNKYLQFTTKVYLSVRSIRPESEGGGTVSTSQLKARNMSSSNIDIIKSKSIAKIQFLEDQLTSLGHYLPDTYEYLMRELDIQKRILAEIEIQEHFSLVDKRQ